MNIYFILKLDLIISNLLRELSLTTGFSSKRRKRKCIVVPIFSCESTTDEKEYSAVPQEFFLSVALSTFLHTVIYYCCFKLSHLLAPSNLSVLLAMQQPSTMISNILSTCFSRYDGSPVLGYSSHEIL